MTANPHKGQAEIALSDGRTLTLEFNANAWIAAEDALGKTTPDIIDELQGGRASMKTQRALMWAGLQKHHPEIGIEEAGELLIEAAKAMSSALAGGAPQPDEGGAPGEGNAGPSPAKPGRGTASATAGAE